MTTFVRPIEYDKANACLAEHGPPGPLMAKTNDVCRRADLQPRLLAIDVHWRRRVARHADQALRYLGLRRGPRRHADGGALDDGFDLGAAANEVVAQAGVEIDRERHVGVEVDDQYHAGLFGLVLDPMLARVIEHQRNTFLP